MRERNYILKIICLCQIFFILAQSARYTSIVFSYQMNKDFVSKYLCEKKEASDNDCHGKCYLMKKLHAEDSEESSTIPMKYAGEELFGNLNTHSITFFLESKSIVYSAFCFRLHSGFKHVLIRPPSIA